MSTYEALRFFGLDYYATASDIKAAYRVRASALRPDPATASAKLVREAEERMQMLNRAYAALQHRVDNTPPDVDPLASAEAGAKPKAVASGFRTQWNRNLASEWLTRLRFPRVPEMFPRIGISRVGRAAAVVAVMVAVGYGIMRGSAEKYPALSVVDAKSVSVQQAEPLPPVQKEHVTAAEQAPAALEKKAPVVAEEPRPLRAPKLPGVAPEEAKAIGAACLAETGEDADAFHACVERTALETPHAIHLD